MKRDTTGKWKGKSLIYSCGGAAALFLLFLPAGAVAQDQIITAPNAGQARQKEVLKGARERLLKEAEDAPTPRLADGHPDLNGRWTGAQVFCDPAGKCQIDTRSHGYTVFKDPNGTIHADRLNRDTSTSGADNEKNGAAYQYYELFDGDARRASNPNKPPYKAELMAKVADLDLHANEVDPKLLCHPNGIPREGAPNRIVQAPGVATFLYADGENGNWWRIVPTDGRPHRDDLDPSYFGDSVGHWEGDTLVVDVTGFNDDTWFGGDGWFHSEALHVVERITRKGNILHYQATVEDPNVLTRPWVISPVTFIANTDPEAELYEVARCENQDVGHIVNHDHF